MSKRRTVTKAPPVAAARKGWKSWEVMLAVVGTLASIAGLVVGVIPLLKKDEPEVRQEPAGVDDGARPPAGGGAPSLEPAQPAPMPLPPPGPKREETQSVSGGGEAGKRVPIMASSPKRRPAAEELPRTLLLEDGDQEVLLDGLVGLSVEFGKVGAEPFMTLHVNVEGREPQHHPILGAGERVGFEVRGKKYAVAVLKVDWEAKTGRLRMDAVPNE